MSTTTGVEGKCACGWVIPAVCTGLVTPEGVTLHPSVYTTGVSMLVMMKCPVCRRTMRQTAPITSTALVKGGQALEAFEAFCRAGDADRRSGPTS